MDLKLECEKLWITPLLWQRLIFIGLAWALFGFGCKTQPKSRRLNPTLTLAATDKSPMGAFVFRYFYGKAFDDVDIAINRRPFDSWYKAYVNEYDDEDTEQTVYCAVAPALKTWHKEANAMADFVERGNCLMLASNSFEPDLLEFFGLEYSNNVSFLGAGTSSGMRDTHKWNEDTSMRRHDVFHYPFLRSLSTDSSRRLQWLGFNEDGTPDALRVKYGRGELIVVTNAGAFSNYFLLQKSNHAYALSLLSYLPSAPQAVFWDDFYRRVPNRQSENGSVWRDLMAIPHIRMAFFLLLFAALAWVVTNMFRQQRKIALVKPSVNSSLEFTQTIARLYFNKKDNRNIAQKMLVYFADWLRQTHFVHTARYDEQFVNGFAEKLGIDRGQVQLLADTIHTVQHNATVSDETLLILNRQMQLVMGMVKK